MSGLPNINGVKELQQLFRDFRWARERIAEIKQSIADSQENLAAMEKERDKSLTAIETKMREMDVYSTGNAGYEQRRFELLRMMSDI